MFGKSGAPFVSVTQLSKGEMQQRLMALGLVIIIIIIHPDRIDTTISQRKFIARLDGEALATKDDGNHIPIPKAADRRGHNLKFFDRESAGHLIIDVPIILVEPGIIRTAMDQQRFANEKRMATISGLETELYGKFYRGFQKAASQEDPATSVSAEEVAARSWEVPCPTSKPTIR